MLQAKSAYSGQRSKRFRVGHYTIMKLIGKVNGTTDVEISYIKEFLACVAGPQFYGGPDLQRAGFWRACHAG